VSELVQSLRDPVASDGGFGVLVNPHELSYGESQLMAPTRAVVKSGKAELMEGSGKQVS
jgi:hypothetical protein